MRLRPRVDRNQAEIVDALRRVGCSVQSLAAVGSGCPDLLVGKAGINYLLEVKDHEKAPSARVLTRDQREWHASWNGWAFVVGSAAEALEIVVLGGRAKRRRA